MALLPQDPKKQKQVIFGLLPIVALVVYYQFVYSPRALAIAELEENVTNLTAKTQDMKNKIIRYGPNLAGRIAIFEEHIKKLEDLIPRREDVPMVISQVTEQAGINGVELVALNPGAEDPGEFYARQSYALAVIGDYHSIGEYLASIGSLARIVRPLGVNISLEPGRPATRNGPMLKAEFRIDTFIMPDPNAVKPDSAAAAAGTVPVTTGG